MPKIISPRIQEPKETELPIGTAYFCKYIQQRIANNKNFIGVCTGPTGSGKSYAMNSLAHALNGNLPIENICLTGEEILRRINDKVNYVHAGQVLIWDEAGVDLGAKQWQSVANRVINLVLQTFRLRNIILLLTVPYFSFLDSDTRKLCHCVMETQGVNKSSGSSYLKPLLIQVNQHSGQMYTKYLRVRRPAGNVVPVKLLKLSLTPKSFNELYEAKKKKFTEDLNKDALERLLDYKKKTAGKRVRDKIKQEEQDAETKAILEEKIRQMDNRDKGQEEQINISDEAS